MLHTFGLRVIGDGGRRANPLQQSGCALGKPATPPPLRGSPVPQQEPMSQDCPRLSSIDSARDPPWPMTISCQFGRCSCCLMLVEAMCSGFAAARSLQKSPLSLELQKAHSRSCSRTPGPKVGIMSKYTYVNLWYPPPKTHILYDFTTKNTVSCCFCSRCETCPHRPSRFPDFC